MITIEEMRELIFGPSGETKTEIMLQTAEKLGLKVIKLKCSPMTEEDRKGIPIVKAH